MPYIGRSGRTTAGIQRCANCSDLLTWHPYTCETCGEPVDGVACERCWIYWENNPGHVCPTGAV